MNVFPTSYFPSIDYMKRFLESEHSIIDSFEHYEKQSCRNRTYILTAQGEYPLIVPVIKKKHFTPVCEVKISYKEDWMKIHWRAIVSAYAKSPYFQYYDQELKSVLWEKPEFLLDFNTNIMKFLLQTLQLEKNILFSENYIEKEKLTTDFRHRDFIKNRAVNLSPVYAQVFDYKYPFIPNLSMLDLLFNLGPEASLYLKSFKL